MHAHHPCVRGMTPAERMQLLSWDLTKERHQNKQIMQIKQRASHSPRPPPAKDVTVTANQRPPLKRRDVQMRTRGARALRTRGAHARARAHHPLYAEVLAAPMTATDPAQVVADKADFQQKMYLARAPLSNFGCKHARTGQVSSGS
jgi:hypothetical protein